MMTPVDPESFARGYNPGEVRLITLEGPDIRCQITTIGARLVSLFTPDRNGEWADLVLGYDKADGYFTDQHCLGAVVGRVANRISGARFSVEGREYSLEPNEGENLLHGGSAGLQHKTWKVMKAEADLLLLECTTTKAEDGFPGALTVQVQYRILEDQILRLDYRASTTKTCPVNLTNHSYFNLSGKQGRDISGHILQSDAPVYLPIDENGIPTGELRPVDGSAFDFQTETSFGQRLVEFSEVLAATRGYDHYLIVEGSGFRPFARLSDQASGRFMTVWSDCPGFQLYTGNSLAPAGGNGEDKALIPQGALCIETQAHPNAINQAGFPDSLVHPGETFRSCTEFRFGNNSPEG